MKQIILMKGKILFFICFFNRKTLKSNFKVKTQIDFSFYHDNRHDESFTILFITFIKSVKCI